MKKLFVLLLALSCAGFVFAEDAAPALKLSGAIYGSVEVLKAGDADPVIVFARSDSKGYEGAWRTRINGAFTDGDYGLNFRLQKSKDEDPTFTRSFAWGNFFGGILGVKAGFLYEGAWMTQGDAAFGEQDSVGGFSLNVKPIEGLAFGTYVPVGLTPVLLEDAFKNAAFGAAYTMEGLGGFQLGYLGSAADKQADLYFGFNLTMVENLTAALEIGLMNLGQEDTVGVAENAGLYEFVETIEYAMEPITVGFIGYQKLYTTADAVFGMSFNPYVNYAMGAATLGLDVTYAMDADDGTNVVTTDAIGNWDVTPSVAFALGGNTLKLGAHIGDPNMDADDDNYVAGFAYFEWAF